MLSDRRRNDFDRFRLLIGGSILSNRIFNPTPLHSAALRPRGENTEDIYIFFFSFSRSLFVGVITGETSHADSFNRRTITPINRITRARYVSFTATYYIAPLLYHV